ncbi:hypothetical protein F4809DRAFT_227109 [Biscogniauxia mediterranea]|nr:hypothetical protein F4809DRAFT_227109 [Biscogniauxia mediterranea]
MPRKIRGPADLAQNRQNQRQCRARKQEYVAALEARLREYEAREVQASLDMQQAARAVAWKNERLLMLLARHGVAQGEIDAFLQLSDAQARAMMAPRDSSHAGTSLKTPDSQAITPADSRLESRRLCTTTADGGSNSLSTSCDAAASILANLKGHDDTLQAREVLGCGSQKNCHIRNTRLFQLMDEAA